MWMFLSHYRICYNIASVLCFNFLSQRDGISAPSPGIKLTPPALEGKILITGQPGKSCVFVSKFASVSSIAEFHFHQES